MRRSIPVFLLAASLAILLSSAVLAGSGKRPHPSKLEYPPLRVTTPVSIDISLPNGLQGFLVEDHEIPVVDVVLLVRTYFPDEGKYGLNEMARWVLRNGGTASWPGDKLSDELEYLAATVEVYGSDLSSTISFNCLKRDLPHVLEIFADLVMNPTFPEDKVELKRKTMQEEIRRQNDQPAQVAEREYNRIIYQGHPYGWETTVASVDATTRDDLVQFHRRYFHPSNAIVGISGDVTRDEIVAALEKALGGWSQEEVTIPKVPDLASGPAASVNYAYMDINQAYITMGHQGINANDPDRCAVNIANYILGGGSFTSWITEKVRNDAGLAYDASSRYSADPFAKGVFAAEAQTKADACGRATTIILDQIKRMKDVGPTADEVKRAVDSYVNGQVFDNESKTQVVRRLVSLRFEGRPLDTPQRDMDTYAKLSLDDVRRAAQKYLHPDKLTLLVVGNAQLFDRPLSDFGTVNEVKFEKE
jgi:predicted Zn-dependent peptidase